MFLLHLTCCLNFDKFNSLLQQSLHSLGSFVEVGRVVHLARQPALPQQLRGDRVTVEFGGELAESELLIADFGIIPRTKLTLSIFIANFVINALN